MGNDSIWYSFLLFLYFGSGICNPLLKLRFVCDSYQKCLEEKSELVQICDGNDRKWDKKCAKMMKSDIDGILKYEEAVKIESKNCIDEDLKRRNESHVSNRYLNDFCGGYLFNTQHTDGDCSVRVARLQNRCETIRRCCEPAVRCEQQAVYSENGRTIRGLKEEVEIKMAECAQHENEVRPRPETAPVSHSKSRKSPRKLRIIESPPFSLCLKYLQCQKDAHDMRVNCSKRFNRHSIDGLDSDDVSSVTWQHCKTSLEEDFNVMNERRKQAFAYLDKCVPIANVTREFMITDRVCRASVLKGSRKPNNGILNCHMEVSTKRKECALLRDCCVQADVCERSALYAVISDEYLLRRTQLRETLESCMKRPIDEENVVV